MRPLEFNMNVGRTQDISPIKQAQEEKPLIVQQQIVNSNEKAVDIKQQRVYQKKDEDMDSEYDASKEGFGAEYGENHKKHDKKKEDEEDGHVQIKGHAVFDVRI